MLVNLREAISSVCTGLVLQKRPRDFCWAKEGDVLPLIEHLELLQVEAGSLASA